MDSPYGRKTRELTRKVKEIYAGKDAPIYATGFSPIMVLKSSIDGMEFVNPRLPKMLEEDPESVVAALNILADAIMDLNEMLIKECGVDGIYSVSYTHLDVYKRQGRRGRLQRRHGRHRGGGCARRQRHRA